MNFPEFWQNFDRILMWKVRMVRSVADRTFQPWLWQRRLVRIRRQSCRLLRHARDQDRNRNLHGRSWVVAQQQFFVVAATTKISCRNLQNLSGFFFRFCNFLTNLRIFGTYLRFPAIPTKFRENLDEKSPILDDFSNILQKSKKNYWNFANFRKKSANFEFGAVQRYVYLVDLEKCYKNEYLVAKIGLDTA